VDDLNQRLVVLRGKIGREGLLTALIDALYERGSLGELLDEVEATLEPPKPDAEEEQAREAYTRYTDNHPTIHCNRFPPWDELSQKNKDIWREAVRRQNELATTHLDLLAAAT
jgi:hypothetical protein